MIIGIEDLPRLVSAVPDFHKGCLIDTNVLFAASFPLDRLNEWAEKAFSDLEANGIPRYTNINIRSEFIDLNRRVLLPEGLVSLYDEARDSLGTEVEAQLKSLKTQKDNAASEGKAFKFNDQQIKKYRDLLASSSSGTHPNAWDLFCRDYLEPFITGLWDEAVDSLGLKFVGTRAIDDKEFFSKDPKWEDMVRIVGRSGIGSSDAMIINLFQCSRFPLIVTADSDIAYTVEHQVDGEKYVLAP